MKRAYQICSALSSWGFILLFLVFHHWLDEHPTLLGLCMLPFTLFAAVAAFLNHLLPPAHREQLTVNWGYRIHIRHPYWTLFIFFLLNFMFFLLPYQNSSWTKPLLLILVVAYVFTSISTILFYHFRKRKTKRPRRQKRPKL